jgi:putative tricarboxylic transport membrane protein
LQERPDMFWGIVGSMYIGNVVLLILNLPLIPLWVQVLRIPGKILYPMILLFCLVGAYGINNNVFDVYVMIVFGVAGYLFKKFGYECAPLILAFVLGPMFEVNLRRSLIISEGSFSIFFTRPISLAAIAISITLIMLSVYQSFRSRRQRNRT